MKRIKRKNGFSLAEVIVALAIVAIVSVAALSIVSSSINARVNAINRTNAQIFADNILECFKASENESGFKNNVQFAVGVNISDGTDGEYVLSQNAFSSEIKFIPSDEGRRTIEIEIKDSDGDSIISITYVKGD